MTIMDSTAFIAINNSGKIFSINTNTFEHSGTLAGLISPRYIEILNPTKGYISDLYSTVLVEFNPSSMQISDSVIVGRSTEQMIYHENHLYVNCWSFGNEVIKINTETNLVVGEVQLNKQPNSMVLDKNDMLWVLSDGGFEGSQLGVDFPALTQINPETMEINQSIQFPSKSGSPNNLCINNTLDSLSFLYGSWSGEEGFDSGIYKMAISDRELPASPLIPEGDHLFYRMGIDPTNSTIYVSDALDYLQKGYVFRYNPDGSMIDSLKADRIPGFFTFAETRDHLQANHTW